MVVYGSIFLAFRLDRTVTVMVKMQGAGVAMGKLWG